MDIELTSDTLIYYKPYRLSYSERKQVQEMIEELKAAGIVGDSTSPYGFPILLVRKKNGEIRMCVDYRKLNLVTKRKKSQMLQVDDHLDGVHDMDFCTILDFRSSYYQLPLSTESREFSAFVTPDGNFQWKAVPF